MYIKSINFINLDQSTMGQLVWCTLHDYWGGKPLYPINKIHLNSFIINISTHFVHKMG